MRESTLEQSHVRQKTFKHIWGFLISALYVTGGVAKNNMSLSYMSSLQMPKKRDSEKVYGKNSNFILGYNKNPPPLALAYGVEC